MAHLDSISVVILGAIALIVSAGLVLIAVKRFEIAVLFVALSSVVSLLNPSNEPVPSGELETGLVSYARAAILALMGAVGIVKYLQVRLQGKGRKELISFSLQPLFLWHLHLPVTRLIKTSRW